ncbi:MAG: YceI family protein [Gammaproteobacteria bacterium]|nr:YceI family protein [Gammaproteobacteria bacterium]
MRLGRILSCALMLGLAACRVPPPPREPATAPLPGPGVALFQIDTARSQLTLRVYREGPLAALGHNHIIAVQGLEGSVQWHPDPARCSLLMRFAVGALSVDDPALRAAAGADFADEVGAAARSGTRDNMLGPRLLDAARYPDITLISEGVSGSAAAPRIALRAYVAGHDALLEVPAQVQRDAAGLRATGDLAIRQTALGLTPFSVLLGALRVADTVHLHFDIRARSVAVGGRAP